MPGNGLAWTQWSTTGTWRLYQSPTKVTFHLCNLKNQLNSLFLLYGCGLKSCWTFRISIFDFVFLTRLAETNPDKEARLPLLRPTPRCCLTCFKACSSRLCLQTESLHTVSQRVLSSWSCPFTQVVSSRLFSISSRPDRFRTWTVPVRFPSSFWKTWKRKQEN